MTPDAPPSAPLDIWGGVECTQNRVGDRWFDQVAWSGHDRRADDLDRFASLGIRTLRYPLLWERLAPRHPDEIDWHWTDDRLARMQALDIRPIAGLVHHGSGPGYTSLLDDGFAAKLAHFAGAVAHRYPWLTDFTPVNEPLTTARFSGLYGHWYPHAHADRDYVRALISQTRATVLAMRAIRKIIPAARLIQTEDCGRTFGRAAMRGQVAHEEHRRWLTWDLLTGRVDDRHPLHAFLVGAGMTAEDEAFLLRADCPPDVLGINYYVTSDRYLDDRLDRYPVASHGGNPYLRYADVEAVRARPRGIAGCEAHLVAAARRYGLPVALTEVHLGCSRDEQLRWLVESWHCAQRARAQGADVRALTVWALLGSYNWDSLVTRDAGHYEPGVFDVRGPSPRETALAAVVRTLVAGEEPRHPLLAGTPWWHRSDRLTYGAERRSPVPKPGGSPILIFGADGTLGGAFARICRHRGLASELVDPGSVNVADPAQLEELVPRYEPWAIVDATDEFRVDEHEREPERGWQANVTGPVNLALACRRFALPLLTFSSDLVFDGRRDHAYREDDRTGPLGVYGATKVDMERRVRALLPDALLVRTSALFGRLYDDHFLERLFHAIDAGEPFKAPVDCTVSPTFVPDLVHASLDLLVDGESGLWHLANQGATTWLDFALAAARRSGRAVDLIVPAEMARIWGPAARPLYSALSSRRANLLRPLDEALDAYLHDAPNPRVAAGTGACASR